MPRKKLLRFFLIPLLVVSAAFAFHARFLEWSQALFQSLTTVTFLTLVGIYNVKVLIPNFMNRRGIVWYLLNVLAILALTVYLFGYSGWLEFFEVKVEFTDLINGKTIERDSSQVKSFVSVLMVSVIILGSLAYSLFRKSLRKQREQAALEKAKLKAEYAYLKAQINPHFFLNALNGWYALSRISPQETGDYVTKLSEMLRFVTYEATKEKIRLDDEIRHMRNYLYFQEQKEDSTQVIWHEELDDSGQLIEPMLLIPFVENAVKHSHTQGEEPIRIEVSTVLNKRKLSFSCVNSLPKAGAVLKEDEAGGIGIENVELRLKMRYPGKFTLDYGPKGDLFHLQLEIEFDD